MSSNKSNGSKRGGSSKSASKSTSKSASKSTSKSTSKSRSAAQTRAQRAVKKEAVKYAKKHTSGLVIAVAVLLVIALAAALIIYFFFPQVWDRMYAEYLEYTKLYYNDSADNDPAGTDGKQSAPVAAGDLESIATADFSIHFLEVGNSYAGDCTLIKCGDTEVLIDAGSRENSAATINSYIGQYVTDGTIEYVIATHAHQDHIAGFVGKKSGATYDGVLYRYSVGTIIQFAGHNTNSGIYNSYVAAVTYAESKGAVAYTALDCWKETGKKAGQSEGDARSARKQYDLSGDGNLTLNVLYNYYYENKTSDENDYSVCVLLTYKGADGKESNYLFTGDLEGKGEEYLVKNNTLPQVELFKGGHHGSKTSSTDKLLNVIQPKNVAICCCAGTTEYTSNPDNTFPTQAFIDRISKWTEYVYVTTLSVDYSKREFTSMNGNIVFYVEESRLRLWCSNSYTLLKDTDWFKQSRTCPAKWQASAAA